MAASVSSPSGAEAIRAESLTKDWGRARAVDSLSFDGLTNYIPRAT